MKQVLQDLSSGKTTVTDVPAPGLGANDVLIQTRRTLISAGTERMLIEFGQASLIGKARAQPEKVKQVLAKIRTDGLLPTLEAVFNQLGEPLPLGYCNAGVVLEVGQSVSEFKPGDRVVSNGPHAEIVAAPKLLCAKVPDQVSDDQAAFTVLASVALQGLRLIRPTLGETVVVFGLGLIGLVSVQLLRANGCRVIGIDVHPNRLRLAESFGAQVIDARGGGDPPTGVRALTLGRGADAVLITASAKTDDIVQQSAQMCRKRGRLVLVGVVGLGLNRSDFYEKELSFQVSCSYGPGRYDSRYEQQGQDYPLGYVRWTEQRNFEAVLDLLADGRLVLDGLITHHVAIDQAPEAYRLIQNEPDALGVLLDYPTAADRSRSIKLSSPHSVPGAREAVLGVIGAGNFAKMILMPALTKAGARIRYVADLKGNQAQHLASKFGVERAVTDYRMILDDSEVNAVVIAVGHHLHARFVCEALAAGKHTFVEKPLAMNVAEVRRVIDALDGAAGKQLAVGFNRRFSPHVVRIKQLLAGRSEPLAMTYTINAGYIPPDVWVHDPERGGGRIVGEACHFIDLLAFLAGEQVVSVAAHQMGGGVAVKEDKMSISVGFSGGSVGTVNYYANGSKSYPKELLEIFSEQRVLRLENFRKTTGYGFSGFRAFKTIRQDKGHRAQFAEFVRRIASSGEPLIPAEELVNATLASFAAMTAASESRTVSLANEYAESLAIES